MGKISTKDNKTEFQIAREVKYPSRLAASEELGISCSTLEKIENGITRLQPDYVLAMADAYDRPRSL